jgi:hypothetical protein
LTSAEDDSDVVFQCVFALLAVSFVDFVIGITVGKVVVGFANEFTNMKFRQTNKTAVPTKSGLKDSLYENIFFFPTVQVYQYCQIVPGLRTHRPLAPG